MNFEEENKILKKQIAKMKEERLKLDKRIHNQRVQLRQDWRIFEQRQKWIPPQAFREKYYDKVKRHNNLIVKFERFKDINNHLEFNIDESLQSILDLFNDLVAKNKFEYLDSLLKNMNFDLPSILILAYARYLYPVRTKLKEYDAFIENCVAHGMKDQLKGII